MTTPSTADNRDWPYLLLVLGLAVVPVVYFYNGLATEYYFSKSLWAGLLLPTALGWKLAQELRRGTLTLPRVPTALPLVLFWLWSAASLLWSTNPGKGIEVLTRVGAAPLAFAGAAWLVRDTRRVRGVLLLQLWAAALVCLYGFVQYFEVVYLPYDQYGDPDPSSTIGLTNFVVEYMILLVAAPLALLYGDRRRWARFLYVGVFVLMLAYFMVARNRNGFIGLVVVAVAVALLLLWLTSQRHGRRLRLRPRTVLAGALAGVLAGAALFGGTTVGQRVLGRMVELFEVAPREDVEAPVSQRLVQRLSRDPSVRFRLQTWYQALDRMFPVAPWLGVGLGNLEIEFPRFYTAFLEGMTIRNNTRIVEGHNEYVQYLIDLGLIGLVLFMWLLVQLVRTAAGSLQRCRDPGDLALWLALHAGLPGYTVMAFFAFPLHLPTSAIAFFGLSGLSAAHAHVLARRDGVVDITLDVTPSQRRHAVELLLAGVVVYGFVAVHFSYHAMVAEVRSKEARVYRHNKRHAEAERLISEAIAHNPRHEGFYFDRAVSRQEQGNLSAAYKDLERVAELVPYYGMGREQIGMLAMGMGNVDAAIEHLRAAATIYPSRRARIERMAAEDALQAGRPDATVKLLAESVAAGTAPPAVLAMFVEAMAALGRGAEALATLDSYAVPDENLLVPAARAIALTSLGRGAEAVNLWQMLTPQAPQNWAVWYGLTRAAAAAGHGGSAVTALQRALALEPRLTSVVVRDTGLLRDEALRAWIEANVGPVAPDPRLLGPWLVPPLRKASRS